MYVYVDNSNKKAEFMTLWSQIAREKKYPITELRANSEAFIIKNKEGLSIGTIEFIRCDKDVSNSSDLINITNEKRIEENLEHSYQIRKIGLKSEFTNTKVLYDLLKLAITYAKKNGVKYYVTYLEKKHYHLLTEKYKLRIERLGENSFLAKSECVPVLIDIEDTIYNTRGYPLHIKSIALVVQGTKKVKSLFV
ncbi:hypothetical protein ACFFHM_00120 [Halalkalibacter kiskunsagensis]|uniref:N-acetyltransferase domain-containing protein n=1 Tax=Halalkalibacter kiskunsagensis TaxID=1548599 RepID=A0ABV6K6S8_9BACI